MECIELSAGGGGRHGTAGIPGRTGSPHQNNFTAFGADDAPVRRARSPSISRPDHTLFATSNDDMLRPGIPIAPHMPRSHPHAAGFIDAPTMNRLDPFERQDADPLLPFDESAGPAVLAHPGGPSVSDLPLAFRSDDGRNVQPDHAARHDLQR